MAATGLSEARRWMLDALLCLPYWLVWLAPALLAPPPLIATGFSQYDQPYYVANGRAVFERGNGLLGHTYSIMDVTRTRVVPYFSGLPTVDVLGKSDRHIARHAVHRFAPGHSKWDWD